MRNIATVSVSPKRDERRCEMDIGLYSRIKEYNTALAVIKEMLSGKVITDGDYTIICTILAEKYGMSSCSIFAGIDLINTSTDGNI